MDKKSTILLGDDSQVLLNDIGKIAGIGGWELDAVTEELSWTEEVYRIHEVAMTWKPTVEEAISFYVLAARPAIEQAIRRAVNDGEDFDLELEIITAKNNHRWVHVIGKADLRQSRVYGIFQDITKRYILEEQLRLNQRLESIGILAGGIAHNFNNILAGIIGYGQFTLMKMPADDPLRQNIMKMLEGADRAAYLTKELLQFSEKHVIEKKAIDLNLVVAKVGAIAAKAVGEQITYSSEIHDAALPVLADGHLLEQALMNLATNARDFMPHGGTLTVNTGFAAIDRAFITSNGFGEVGSYALITVADSGTGMDEATKLRIFEPFLTTKEIGKGTGLGLSVVYGIIKQHNGYIKVWSEPGKGTSFTIYLPLIDAEPEEEIPAKTETVIVGGSETILVVEEDEQVRILSASILENAGYTAIAAVNGTDAVNRFAQCGEVIDLLLIDLILSDMDSKEVFHGFRKLQPGLRVIFVVDYLPETVRQELSAERGAALMIKPLVPNELLLKVRTLLDEEK